MPRGIKGARGRIGKISATPTTRNISNTGQMSTQTSTTGATGSVTNTTNISSIPGRDGTPGVVDAAIRSTPGVEFNRGSFSVNPQVGVTHPVGDYGDTIRSAYTQVEGHLTQARQQALGQVPREYHDRVNEAFDRAGTQISEHRKKMGY